MGFIEIDYEDISDLRLTTEYRVDKNLTWLTTLAVPGSEDGIFYVGVAGVDFRFLLTGTNLGAENVQNGDFSSSTGWTLQAAHTITGGQLVYDGTLSALNPFQAATDLSVALVEGNIYRVDYEIVALTNGGGAQMRLGDTFGPMRKEVGFYSDDILVTGDDLFLAIVFNFVSGVLATCTLESVSVKQVGVRINRMDVRYDAYDNRGARSPRIKQQGVQ